MIAKKNIILHDKLCYLLRGERLKMLSLQLYPGKTCKLKIHKTSHRFFQMYHERWKKEYQTDIQVIIDKIFSVTAFLCNMKDQLGSPSFSCNSFTSKIQSSHCVFVFLDCQENYIASSNSNMCNHFVTNHINSLSASVSDYWFPGFGFSIFTMSVQADYLMVLLNPETKSLEKNLRPLFLSFLTNEQKIIAPDILQDESNFHTELYFLEKYIQIVKERTTFIMDGINKTSICNRKLIIIICIISDF